jgi:biopolymer transport protein ExbD
MVESTSEIQKVTVENLPSSPRESARKASHHVYVSAEERAKYSDAKAVVDKIGEAGIRKVSLPTDLRRPR